MMHRKFNRRRGPAARTGSGSDRVATRNHIETLERRVLLAANAATLLADASVRNDLYADVNFGAGPKLFVQTPVSVTSDTQITFLKFDISNVTSISSATLALNASLSASGDPAITVGVFAVADTSWVEGTGTGSLIALPPLPGAASGITWNTQPAIGAEIPGATATITSQKLASQSFDLTAYLQQQKLEGKNVVSLAIESITQGSSLTPSQQKKKGAGIVQFDSREKGVAPVLTIQSSFLHPTAKLTASNVTSGSAHETVVAEYSGPEPIDLTSIAGGANGNLRVSGPGSPKVGAVSVNPANPTDVFATYTINPPKGALWTAADSGTYTVSLVDQQVKDITGIAAFSVSTAFSVNPDTTPPSVVINASSVTSASLAPKQIVVIYKDASGVAANTIAASNISVSGPAGPLVVAGVTKSSAANAQTITATYSVTPLDGGWSYASDGSYQISFAAGSVTDVGGNAAPASSSSFVVNIPTPADPNDATFSRGNSVMAPFTAEATAFLSNGDVVVVGEQTDASSGNSQGVIELFNADGTVASGFGNNGIVTTPASANEAFHAVLAQGSNFIVAGSGGGFLLRRYTTSGLDASFGINGSSVTDFGGTTQAAYALTTSPSGGIVAGGSSDGNFAIADYDANGSLVGTFGQSGRQLFDVGSATDVVGALAFQSNGNLVAAGSTGAQVVLARLNTAGIADATFGSAGLVIVPGLVASTAQSTGDHSEGLAIESDNSILVANQTASGHFGVVHLDANGNVITSFGTNGLATASFGTNDDADAVFVQPGGQIVVAGTTDGATALAAFDKNGVPIVGFGLLGNLTFPAPVGAGGGGGASSDPTAFATQTPDGHLILGTNGFASASIVRKLSVAGTKNENAGTPLGSFSPGAKNRLTVSINNTNVTLSITGGAGEAFLAANGLHLVIAAAGPGATLTITMKGGSHHLTLGDVTVTGSLRSLVNRSVDLAGTVSTTGAIGTLSLGNVVDGTIAAAGNINSLSLLGASDAHILAGANLGADGELGGSGTDADLFSPGVLRNFRVAGSFTTSVIAAGVDPVDDIYLDSDDQLLGGPASIIRAVFVHNIDQSTRFIAGAFGPVHLPKKAIPGSDSHLEVL